MGDVVKVLILPIVGILVISIICITIIFSLKEKQHSFCSQLQESGECILFDPEKDDTCHCIAKLSNTETAIYEHSEAKCKTHGGILAVPDNDKLLKWLAKRLYLMGVDNAFVGLRKLQDQWSWMKQQGPEAAINIPWRAEFTPDQNHEYALITVESIIQYGDENEYTSYNYDFYIDYDESYQWYGFKSSDNTAINSGGTYYICHYTSEFELTEEVDVGPASEGNMNMQNSETNLNGNGAENEQDAKINPTSTQKALVNDQTTLSDDHCECTIREPIELSLSEDSVEFTSPNYPHNYCENQECGWVIHADSSFGIKLEWIAFNMEKDMDFVFVYDAQQVDHSKLLASCTGTRCTDHMSSDEYMYIHFLTDHVTNDLGFKAKVTAVQTDACYCSDLTETTLGSLEESYSLTSPNFPNGYCLDQKCAWKVSAPEGYGLHVTWNQFSTESADVVSLYDGNIFKQNCSSTSCDDVVTAENELKVQFESDSQNSSHIGFSAIIKVVRNFCDKSDVVAPVGSVQFTKERADGFIALKGTAELTCPLNHKIQGSHDDVSDAIICTSPNWNRQFEECIRVCPLTFSKASDFTDILHICDFGSISKTMLVPEGHDMIVERYDRANGEQLSTLVYRCTKEGWSEEPICPEMIQAILIIGGQTHKYEYLDSIGIYIPQRNSTKFGIKLLDGRQYKQTSVALDNGKVLVLGSYDDPAFLRTQIIDMNTNQISHGPNLTTKRVDAAATTLDGEVYICGGDDLSAMDTCQVFSQDPWSSREIKMTHIFIGGQLVALNGSIYAVGGHGYGAGVLNVVERCSPQTDQWEKVAALNQRRYNFGATVVNHRIYVCGGLSDWDSVTLKSCECYNPYQNSPNDFNPNGGTWKEIAQMIEGRSRFSLVLLGQMIYALGGQSFYYYADYSESTSAKVMDSVESYNPETNLWAMEEFVLPQNVMSYSSAVVSIVKEG